MIKIITIVGARPQFVKAAAVSRAISKHDNLKEIIVHTGQHFDKNMSDVFFDEMEIPHPDYNLHINSLSHGAMTGRMIEEIEKVIMTESPNLLLVYGDTNSTLAGALAASKLHIDVAHVEAGLRSYNMKMPEEINRILTDRISNILFCPTERSVLNLVNEGFDNFGCKIVRTGDVMYDAALFYSKKSEEKATVFKKINLKEFVLTTFHRAENTDDAIALENIITGLNKVNSEIPVVFPVHPRTKKIIENSGLKVNFHMIDPVGYFDMLELIKNCKMVFTDSGGLQKEAFFFGKNVITMREQTEWVELIDNGFNILSGANSEKIFETYLNSIHSSVDFNVDLYGDGDASGKIAEEIIKFNNK
ncbi:MAG: UDP-N-acetylglucosamine 2-epimerase (non-hydrolyzing) [Bacteroidetes bacterium]|nr:UDP-N-acetylglucosamine 2-epimerase (non-hydrolyzing) [Bacteroidota bacterium]